MVANLVFLRTIEIGDASFLHHLFQYPAYESLFDEYDITLETWQTRCMVMIQNPRSYDYIVCLSPHNIPIGYIGLFDKSRTLEVELQVMVLEPNYCGRGIGSVLLTQLKNQFHQSAYQEMSLKTATKNKRAKKFYEKHYFSEFGEELIEQSDVKLMELYIKMKSTLKKTEQ